MKYYIATSNLNLDNILQSECILPFPHYGHRVSGYKTFEQIEELRPFSGVVLFAFPVSFEINDPGRYNYPLLIEFEDDKQTSDLQKVDTIEGVYISNHPLQITPLNSRFYFFSENAYKLSLVNTRSNKAIKYYDEYLIYPTASMFHLRSMPRFETNVHPEISVFEDTQIDKQKGSIYAFLLGTKLCVNKEIATQLRLTQELYNILTSIISSPTSFNAFEKKLSLLLNDYRKVDPIEKKSQERFDAKFDEELGRFKSLKSYLIDFLKRINCWDYVFQSLCRKWNCSFLPCISSFVTANDFSRLRDIIENHTNETFSEYTHSSTGDINDITINGDDIELRGASLINIVLKKIIENSLTPENLSANRLEFYNLVMKDIVVQLKNQIGEENWENSLERSYVNNLYSFISDPSYGFSVNDISNIQLKSIAAFIIRGHNFKDYITYLRMAEFEDYRYAITLWGCLLGYMEMNKDVLSDVISIDVYKKIYEKIFGSQMFVITNDPPKSIEITDDFDERLFSNLLDVCKFKESSMLVSLLAQTKSNRSASIEEELEIILNDKPFKRAKKQCDIAREAMKIYRLRNKENELKQFLEKSSLTKNIQSNILVLLGYSKPTKKNKKKIQEPGNLFTDLESSFTPRGTSAMPMLNCLSGIGNDVMRRLEDNWQYTGRNCVNITDHIHFFISLCKKEGSGKSKYPSPLRSIFTENLSKLVEQELKQYYGIR